jgi:hypothetical protein
VKCFHREMATRTGEKVRASREAAGFLHSPRVCSSLDFAGVRKDKIEALLYELRTNMIGSWKGTNLDKSIQEIIEKTWVVDNTAAVSSLENKVHTCSKGSLECRSV